MAAPVQLSFEQRCPLHVAPGLRELQATGPIHRIRTAVGDDAWLVTGYTEVRALLDDPRVGRSHPDPARAARSGDAALQGGPMGEFASEDSDHARLRTLIQPHLSPARLRPFTPRVEALVEECLDRLAAAGPGPVDFARLVAAWLPTAVICALIGVPDADRDRFRGHARAMADLRDAERSRRGMAELFEYCRRLVAVKRRTPGEDVVSRLLARDGVTDEDAARACVLLLFGGEAAVMAIGIGAVLLLTDAGQREELRARPDRMPGAVEEMLRGMDKGGDGVSRYARADLRVGEVVVRAGDLLLLDTGAANHDVSVYAAPDRFDVGRRDAPHLSFGHGSRYCAGAPLARVELRVLFTRLLARFPGMRLAVDPARLRVERDVVAGGLAELPVLL
ncbi:cytochrome P450 [Actinoalloteichus sp. AHMU CJ021]|uniref:Pentalenolactone synthase n=1 Tax=Actinoalloteichus caeruleus DSM 43889 TaxID=1120930 RepID=A0ABT1JDD0_ACTCY|nr:cytochrome P450 [Actinoalloteichus caeruleus]AUS81029.1 cytochrome P450 [Actinoalloteichus sp. AHMU CJ021]MCP2330500.1 pentalenolactone synthase [Actinoalloteichus caeruleus DSM 43889]